MILNCKTFGGARYKLEFPLSRQARAQRDEQIVSDVERQADIDAQYRRMYTRNYQRVFEPKTRTFVAKRRKYASLSKDTGPRRFSTVAGIFKSETRFRRDESTKKRGRA